MLGPHQRQRAWHLHGQRKAASLSQCFAPSIPGAETKALPAHCLCLSYGGWWLQNVLNIAGMRRGFVCLLCVCFVYVSVCSLVTFLYFSDIHQEDDLIGKVHMQVIYYEAKRHLFNYVKWLKSSNKPAPIDPCKNQGQIPSAVFVLFLEKREKIFQASSLQSF